jgi:hypothetical protein
MRKISAIVVLLVLVVAISAPALWALQLPADGHACCRRGGAHHCTESTGTSGFHGELSKCPRRLAVPPITGHSASVLARPVLLYFAPAAISDLAGTTQAKISLGHSSSLLDRGPPSA